MLEGAICKIVDVLHMQPRDVAASCTPHSAGRVADNVDEAGLRTGGEALTSTIHPTIKVHYHWQFTRPNSVL